MKKLRDALESLRGRFAGRNKEDVEKAISMVRYFILFHVEYTTMFKVGNVISFHLIHYLFKFSGLLLWSVFSFPFSEPRIFLQSYFIMHEENYLALQFMLMMLNIHT